MSILDDEEILINNEFPIVEYGSEEIAKKCSKKFFEEYVLTNIIREHKKDDIYISFSNHPTEIRNIGEWMVNRFEANKIKSIIIDGRFSSVSSILFHLAKLPKGSVVIFSELTKMKGDAFLDIIQFLKEWSNTGCLSYKAFIEKGVDTGTSADITLNRNDYHFLYLEEEKNPRKEYFYLSPEPYGEFFIDHSSYAFMKKVEELYV